MVDKAKNRIEQRRRGKGRTGYEYNSFEVAVMCSAVTFKLS